jgi:mannose-6-phosphate isomerase-like protein (cupin superfamily)
VNDVDFLALARGFAQLRDEWPVQPRFDPWERWYSRIAAYDDHEVWLLTWLPGQGTDLHDHGGSSGAFFVVSGALTELTLDRPSSSARPRLRPTELGPGHGRAFGAHHIHQVRNEGTAPTISVHAYGPSLKSMTRYRLDVDGLQVDAVHTAGAQW